jgi:hypothetical protein
VVRDPAGLEKTALLSEKRSGSERASEETKRVQGLISQQDFIVEVRTSRTTGRPNVADDVALLDPLACFSAKTV